jgi:hypothetical protein
LQLENADQQVVSPSPYRSLGNLASAMRLVAPAELAREAAAAGFAAADSCVIVLASKKRFWLQTFRA